MKISSLLKFTGGLTLEVISGTIEGAKQEKGLQHIHHQDTDQKYSSDKSRAFGEIYEKRFSKPS